MPEVVVAKIFELWERDEPITRRRRRVAWRLYRRGREGKGPKMPLPEGEDDEPIEDIARLPQTMDVLEPARPELPGIHTEGSHWQDVTSAGHDHPAEGIDSL